MQAAAIKQRLLGALILVLVGFLAWPLIFDDYQTQPMDTSSRVPPMPDFDEFEIEPYQGPETQRVATAKPAQNKANTEPPKADLPSSKKLQQQNKPSVVQQQQQAKALAKERQRAVKAAPKAWVIQVGSFSKQSNTENLVKKLSNSGLKAYWRRSQGKKQFYTVYVGPYLRSADANADKAKIDKRYNLKAWVKTYQP